MTQVSPRSRGNGKAAYKEKVVELYEALLRVSFFNITRLQSDLQKARSFNQWTLRAKNHSKTTRNSGHHCSYSK
jgi:hypothetical protein